MNPIIAKTLKLALICGIAALLLGVVNTITEPIIEERKELELPRALSALVPDSTMGEPQEIGSQGILIAYPVEREGSQMGYILSMSATGYGGPMLVLAAYELDGEFIAGRLLDNQETIGLGKNAEDPEYMDKFTGLGSDHPLPRTKADLPPEMDDVTGATITFNGLAEQIYLGSQWVKERRD